MTRSRDWHEAGVWEALQAADQLDWSKAVIGSSYVTRRSHPRASTMPSAMVRPRPPDG
jgi:hypothetical protein